MIHYMIRLIGCYFISDIRNFFWFPFLALCFLVTVPVIIRDIFLRRSY